MLACCEHVCRGWGLATDLSTATMANRQGYLEKMSSDLGDIDGILLELGNNRSYNMQKVPIHGALAECTLSVYCKSRGPGRV